jgi:hypothetical protein
LELDYCLGLVLLGEKSIFFEHLSTCGISLTREMVKIFQTTFTVEPTPP